MLAYYTLFIVALALCASAIQITQPSQYQGWGTTGNQLITWTSVDTDPSTVTIQLITPSSPNNPITLATSVSTSSGSYTYNPNPGLTAGNGFRINFIADTDLVADSGILAQSGYFAATSGSTSPSPVAGPATAFTASSTSTPTSASEASEAVSGSSSSSASTTEAGVAAPTSEAATSATTASTVAPIVGSATTSAAATPTKSSSAVAHLAPGKILLLICSVIGIFA
ncbi:MAG: hypothetical protein TREMPRED_003389 [Tremellales sp. Tagirdzhanova-0007]|nr:MAG: hypothetical protein TREMPRED_003389 [Tremellales sp. Tagirdzhanova-0007]